MPSRKRNPAKRSPQEKRPAELSDEYLEEYMGSGSAEAFADFYRETNGWMTQVARASLPTKRSARAEQAEDVAQESLILVFRSRCRTSAWNPLRGSSKNWIRRIVRRQALSLIRRRKGSELLVTDAARHLAPLTNCDQSLPLDVQIEDGNNLVPLDTLADAESLERAERWILTQPLLRQRIFFGLLREGKSLKQISHELGIELSVASKKLRSLVSDLYSLQGNA